MRYPTRRQIEQMSPSFRKIFEEQIIRELYIGNATPYEVALQKASTDLSSIVPKHIREKHPNKYKQILKTETVKELYFLERKALGAGYGGLWFVRIPEVVRYLMHEYKKQKIELDELINAFIKLHNSYVLTEVTHSIGFKHEIPEALKKRLKELYEKMKKIEDPSGIIFVKILGELMMSEYAELDHQFFINICQQL